MKGKIEVRSLAIAYPGPSRFYAVKDLGFRVKPGEFVCLLGPSGCGKTTTLHTIAGLIKPTEGGIWVDEVPLRALRAPRPHIQMVFQQPHLFPWKTVAENIALYLQINRIGPAERTRAVDYYLRLIGLESFKDFFPAQLSLGMQHRVSLARMLVANPAILLMDEPFRSLDYQKRTELQGFLLGLRKTLGKTILFSTHDVDEAILLADRILIMTPGPGRIKKEIKVEFAGERTEKVTTTRKFCRYKEKVLESLRN